MGAADGIPDRVRLSGVATRDRHRLLRRLRRAKDPEAVAAVEREISRSLAWVDRRRRHLPEISYPELPIVEKREEILKALQSHQVVVVCGETGSGKTTQLPKICLEAGFGFRGLIGHTQPRRIAARSLAKRIAEELKTPLGELVGYKVRFQEESSPDTLIKVMTDGILLAEIQGDRYLSQYETIILDEAHERSLNIDFLLGYLKWLLPKRPDLRLIITSATIDPEKFSRHFWGAPVIEVSGRSYPVEIRYRPLERREEDESEPIDLPSAQLRGGRRELEETGSRKVGFSAHVSIRTSDTSSGTGSIKVGFSGRGSSRATSPQETVGDLFQAVADAVEELLIEGHHDVLVFLSGEREIREAAETLRKRHGEGQYEILPLYARLSSGEQQKIFRPGRLPRVILATNVAETSITVPRIRGVVDTGLARISRYSPRSKIQRLPIEPISKASARQRTGRCGRIAPGVCIRLYSREEFDARPDFTEPEILRTNLAAVILRMKALRLGEVERFPFLDPPDRRQVRDGIRLLQELRALDERGELTEIGRLLTRFPIDPQLARMVVEAEREECLSEVITIAAALTIQDPRERPAERAEEADAQHALWQDRRSDFLSYLKLWQTWQEQRRKLSRTQLRNFCREHFLSYRRMLEWEDLVAQLREIVRGELGWRLNQIPAEYDQIHRAILAGLIGHIGKREEKYRYTGTRNLKFYIFPGSGLFKEKPDWIVAAEQVETSKLYGRVCAAIDPSWVEPLAPHLLKRHYTEPHWERETRRVVAYERVTLLGLPIVERRKVGYEPIDPKGAREIFIREALVNLEDDCPLPFFNHNRELLQEIARLREKARRDDLVVDQEQLFSFYDERIPAHIASGEALERWYREAPEGDRRRLFLKREELLEALPVDPEAFPDLWPVRPELKLPLRYRFEPGAEDDGVSLRLPLELLEALSPGEIAWLVPGLLPEKLIFLLKGLPKRVRKPLVPIPETVDRLLPELPFGKGDFFRALSRALLRACGVEIPPDQLAGVELPPYLRLNLQLLDAEGKLVVQGRDLERLKTKLRLQTREAFRRRLEAVEGNPFQKGCRSWAFGTLPEQHHIRQDGVLLPGYLALVDEGEAVGTRLFPTKAEAQEAHERGLLRLLRFALAKEIRTLKNPFPKELELIYARLQDHPYLPRRKAGDTLLEAWLELVLREAFFAGKDPFAIRSEEAFRETVSRGRTGLYPLAQEWRETITEILTHYWKAVQLRKRHRHLDRSPSGHDIDEQLKTLLFRGFLKTTPAEHLRDYPRYLKALLYRLERLEFEVYRDEAKVDKIAPFWEAYWQRVKERKIPFERDPFRWQLEEFRIGLFAQPIKTAYPVSEKRLQKAWEAYRAA